MDLNLGCSNLGNGFKEKNDEIPPKLGGVWEKKLIYSLDDETPAFDS